MDREALRKAQQASRNAYLRKEAQRQERAAAAVLQARLKEVEQGVVPSTVTEAELLLQRSREVRVAGGLLQAAQQRQALAGESVPPMAEGDSAEMTTMAREEQAARLLVVQHMPLPSGHPRQQDEDDDGAHGHDAVGERAEGEGVALCGRTTGRVHRDTTEERAHTARCMATEMPPPSLSAPAVEAAASIAVAATLAAPPTRLSEVDAFVPMSSGEVERRLGDGDYVLEKTMEERQQERVDALQSQHDRLQAQRRGLPIYQIRNELVSLITENQVVIVVGETGSGKTTQILQYLYEEGFHLRRSRDNSTVDSKARNSHARLHSCSAAVMTTSRKGAQDGNCPSHEDSEGDDDDLNNRDNNTAHRHDTSAQEREDNGGVAEMRLLCTQPRRLAAIGVADRVAKEMNCRCGSVVGYRVRFDDKSGPLTRILFLTDGMMLKEFANDPDMRQVAAIMIDEAHERSIDTDILLGLLRDVTRRNRDLRIIVASATINASRFSDFFDHAPVFAVSGRTFPVDTFYSDAAVVDYVAESAATAMALHVSKPLPGDVLIFLPGQDSIELCAEALRKAMEEGTATGDSHTGGSSWQVGASIRPLWILPVYASLAPQEQARIYEPTPPGTRKVVLATNIAETSITIDGVVYVIDCGLCKQNFYNARAMVEELRVVPTSQASATQRAGRAGRTQHGECYRLYTPYTFLNELPVESVPEVRRGSMSAVVLQLKSLGIDNLLQFDFLDPPATESLERALDHLYLLGAMSGTGELTRTGRRMAHFPLEPSMSKSVIRGCALGCGRHAAMAAAMLSLESIFVHSREARVQQQLSSAKVRLLDCRQAGDVVGYVHIMESWLRASSAGVGGGAEFCRTHCIHPRSMRRAQDVLDQMLRTCERVGLSWRARRGEKPPGYEDEDTDRMDGNDIAVNIESLTKSLLSGFFFNVATLEADKRTYRIVRPMDMASGEGGTLDSGRSRHALADAEYDPTAEIHPTSILFRYGAAHGGGGGGERQGTGGATKLGGGGQEGQAALSARERPFLVVFTQLRRTTKRFMMHLTIVPCAEWVLASAPVNYFRKEELESGLRKRLRA